MSMHRMIVVRSAAGPIPVILSVLSLAVFASCDSPQGESVQWTELSDAGMNRPEATITTYYWALREFNLSKIMGCFAEGNEETAREEEAPDHVKKQFDSLEGIRIVSREPISSEEIAFEVKLIGPDWGDKPDRLTLAQAAGQWKIVDMRRYNPDGGAHGSVPANATRRANVNPMIGIWENEDSNTSSITRLEISIEDNTMMIRTWGACSPFDCYWGVVEAEATPNMKDVVRATYVKSFATTRLGISFEEGGHLRCISETNFTDNSGRPFGTTEQFLRRATEP